MSLTIVTASLNAFDNLLSMHNRIKPFLCEQIQWIICDSVRSIDQTSFYFKYQQYVSVLCVDDIGIYDAINQGIVASTGDWIIVLGSDDILFPDIVDLLKCFDPDNYIYAFALHARQF